MSRFPQQNHKKMLHPFHSPSGRVLMAGRRLCTNSTHSLVSSCTGRKEGAGGVHRGERVHTAKRLVAQCTQRAWDPLPFCLPCSRKTGSKTIALTPKAHLVLLEHDFTGGLDGGRVVRLLLHPGAGQVTGGRGCPCAEVTRAAAVAGGVR